MVLPAGTFSSTATNASRSAYVFPPFFAPFFAPAFPGLASAFAGVTEEGAAPPGSCGPAAASDAAALPSASAGGWLMVTVSAAAAGAGSSIDYSMTGGCLISRGTY